MRRNASPKLAAYVGLAATGLLAALALRRPELVVLAAPFALLPALGLTLARAPAVDGGLTLERERVLENALVPCELILASSTGVSHLEAFVRLDPNLTVVEGSNPLGCRLAAGEERPFPLVLRGERWGAFDVGDLYLRARDRLGFVEYETRLDCRRPLKVYPQAEPVRALLRPVQTQVFSGNQVARQRGEGIEFADLRPFSPGDQIRRVNWRATARRRELWVNDYHAERNADVVLFLDSFAEAHRVDVRATGRTSSTLDLAVRAAMALAERYLKEKDRVGFVSFGGRLNWLLPATGRVQLYRIVDSVLDTEIVLNYAWKDIEVIPRRTLPPQALVLALSPLLDDRAADALLDLRSRGFDVAVVEISPLPFAPPGDDEEGRLAYRIWRLKRQAVRTRFAQAGVPVAVWDENSGFSAAIEEVRTFRRYASRARGA